MERNEGCDHDVSQNGEEDSSQLVVVFGEFAVCRDSQRDDSDYWIKGASSASVSGCSSTKLDKENVPNAARQVRAGGMATHHRCCQIT
jgi:hypothetical protein